MAETDFTIRVEFEKADDRGRFVRGFASVVEKDGKAVRDHQGDRIEIDDLRKALHGYIKDARVAKVMHAGSVAGEIVEAVMIDDDFAKALGIADTRRGAWITMEVHDEVAQKRVRSGDLKAFSIGGRGKREDDSDEA